MTAVAAEPNLTRFTETISATRAEILMFWVHETKRRAGHVSDQRFLGKTSVGDALGSPRQTMSYYQQPRTSWVNRPRLSSDTTACSPHSEQ